MFELPRGVWRWLSENARDVARIAAALEKTAEEIALIRAALEEDEQKEDQ
jgi:hypothetical protein